MVDVDSVGRLVDKLDLFLSKQGYAMVAVGLAVLSSFLFFKFGIAMIKVFKEAGDSHVKALNGILAQIEGFSTKQEAHDGRDEQRHRETRDVMRDQRRGPT